MKGENMPVQVRKVCGRVD